MGLLKKGALMFIATGLGLYLATMFVPGVTIPIQLEQFAFVTLVLTSINLFIRPLIKIALAPILILTLGLGSILVNVFTLYLLDFLLPAVTIQGLVALLITTLIISVINVALHFLSKIL